MLNAEVVEAHKDHADAVAEKARQADIDELWASSHSTPLEVIERGLNVSSKTWTVLYNEEPVAIAGVVPFSLLGGVGVPWMIASEAVEKNPVPFLRLSVRYVAEMNDLFPHLLNFVDTRNKTAIRYLRWLGFEIHEPQIFGKDRLPFHLFEMRADHV